MSCLGEIGEIQEGQSALLQVGCRYCNTDEYLCFHCGETKMYKKSPFSHAEGLSDWDLNPIIIWLQYTVCYIVICCSCVFIKVSDFQSRV